MARKSPITERQVIVVNATPLDDDEADYLVSRERERTDRGIPFEAFLKGRPRDVAKFAKRNGRQPANRWKSQLLSGTEKEYDGLAEAVRASALATLDELAGDPFLEASSAVEGHRGHYRTPFYRGQYQMIYKVSKSQRKVVVTRIRRKDEKTYVGHQQSLST
jgi:mRNA-degrading endonuclease RelE of RelBE toxin-antitoxin system